jgi:hypothetical protein
MDKTCDIDAHWPPIGLRQFQMFISRQFNRMASRIPSISACKGVGFRAWRRPTSSLSKSTIGSTHWIDVGG